MKQDIELWNQIYDMIPDLESHEVDKLHDLVLAREAAACEACAVTIGRYEGCCCGSWDAIRAELAAAIRARGVEANDDRTTTA